MDNICIVCGIIIPEGRIVCPLCDNGKKEIKIQIRGNTNMKVKIDDGAFAPIREHQTDAGMDLKSPVNCIVRKRGSVVIDTGVHVELPYGTVGMLKSKSGLNVKKGIVSEGVIDVGYTGSIVVKLYNHSDEDYKVKRGDKITQLVVIECLYPDIEIVDNLEETERGANGFGSTGR